MPQALSTDRLSWGDALFLYLEREGMPLHVAGINLYEGIIPLDACVAFVESRLPLIPRYRQRVMMPPLNFGLPTWEFDPNFDCRNHVHQVTLKRGTDAEIKETAAAILSKVMDRSRPLWDLTLMHDLKRKRTAMLARVHHSMVDGIAGVALMNALMDPTPIKFRPSKKKAKFEVPPPKDALAALLDALVSTPFYLIDRLVSVQNEMLSIAEGVLAGGALLGNQQLGTLVPELMAPVQRLPFNTVCRGPQKFAFAHFSLAEIKAIKNACETTVNDVLLSVTTDTIRRYAEAHGVEVAGRKLRIVVPVNVRNGAEQAGEMGNRISFLPISMPLDISDPLALLAAAHERMMFLKMARAAEFVGLAGGLFGLAPLPLQAAVAPVVSALPISLCNIICTNVPGPQFPLYFMGHRMLHWYPYVPIGGEMGVNVAVLTYDGHAHFGATGDANAAPDLERFEGFLAESFAALRTAVSLKSQPKRAAAKRAQPKREQTKPVRRKPRVSAETKAALKAVVKPAPDRKAERSVAPAAREVKAPYRPALITTAAAATASAVAVAPPSVAPEGSGEVAEPAPPVLAQVPVAAQPAGNVKPAAEDTPMPRAKAAGAA